MTTDTATTIQNALDAIPHIQKWSRPDETYDQIAARLLTDFPELRDMDFTGVDGPAAEALRKAQEEQR